MVAEAFGAWQQLVESYIHHDSGHRGKTDGIDHRRPERKKKSHADKRPGRFGETRYERVAQCLAAVACGMIDWDGDSNPLRDVVEGDGQHQHGGPLQPGMGAFRLIAVLMQVGDCPV